MTQEELDALETSFRNHGFTWNQTNFAVAVTRNHVEPLRQQLDAANTLINKYREETTSLRQQVTLLRAKFQGLADNFVWNGDDHSYQHWVIAVSQAALAATEPK